MKPIVRRSQSPLPGCRINERNTFMTRAILLACVPWLLWLLASFLVVFLLLRASRAKWEFRRLFHLHADQQGSAQTLSFVLTLPLFIMVLLFIVQVSQLMIAQVVVEYAAFAGARAAAVWIPAYVVDKDGEIEAWNRVYGYAVDGDADNQPPSSISPTDGGMAYKLLPTGDKYDKIRMAAALACVSISPSRSLPGIPAPPANLLEAHANAYRSMTGESMDGRLKNKLAYTLAPATLAVDVRFYHSNRELELTIPYSDDPTRADGIPPDRSEFLDDREIGWQDPITVTVRYNLALLPGPGRLLFRDRVPDIVERKRTEGNVYEDIYTYLLTASATMGNEGEKPAYAHYNLP